MEGQSRRELIVRASADGNTFAVRFMDSGPGVSNPQQLFEPFQPGAQASGLGLYLSRTFVRAFQGDIQYEPQSPGCCFAVVLAMATDHEVVERT
jgi:C4-dicarboxylate-specific signal transduction histidine kinase